MQHLTIPISKIDRSGRLRALNLAWAGTLAEEIRAGERLPPIEVVERGDGFRLILGNHRTEGHLLAGRDMIEAVVRSADEYATEAAVRLVEIKENLLRFELTALDRAVAIATWKEIHEGLYEPAKRGRRPTRIDPDKLAQDSAAFSMRFSTVAATALRLSERSIQVSVQIAAGIAPEIRERISAAPIADVAAELLQLAHQQPERQAEIVGLLLADPAAAGTVAEAIALLERIPAPVRLAPWEKVSDRFARLDEREQGRFFAAHADAIDRWLATRTMEAKRAA